MFDGEAGYDRVKVNLAWGLRDEFTSALHLEFNDGDIRRWHRCCVGRVFGDGGKVALEGAGAL